MKRSKRFALLALALVFAMVLGACGSGGSSSPAASSSPGAALSVGGSITPSGEGVPVPSLDESFDWPEMNIIVAHPSVTTDVRHAGWEYAADYISVKTGGKIKLDVYPAGQLGTTRETGEATATGAIHISQNPPANIEPFAPTLGIMNIPFLLPTDFDAGKAVLKGPAGNSLLASISENNSGLMGIALWDALYSCYTSNIDFRESGDMTGQKIRIMSSAIAESAIKSWNGTPIVMDLSEVFTALQTGSIDGQESGIGAGTFSNKYYEVQKYLYRFNHVRSSLITIANEQWWNSLDQQVRDLILESLAAGEAHYDILRLAREDDAVNTMSQYLEIIDLTPEQENHLRSLAQQGCIDLYIASTGESGQKLLDFFMAETEKYR